MERKKLSELSLNLTEKEYREYKAISYSLVKAYLSEGPRAIIAPEFVETEYTKFGRAVDTLLNEDVQYTSLYYVSDMPKVSEKAQLAIDKLIEVAGLKINWQDTLVLDILDKVEYYSNYKPDTKLAKFNGESDVFMAVLEEAGDKIVIDRYSDNMAKLTANTIKEAPYKDIYFPIPSEDIEVFYQIQFTTKYNGIDIKCMFDKVIVNHLTKVITLIDFKTMSELEINFIKSLYRFKYYIQAELYRYVISNILDEDPYYSKFTIDPFTFIVCNKDSLCPLAWEYPTEAMHLDWMNAIYDININKTTGQYKYFPDALSSKAILKLDIK